MIKRSAILLLLLAVGSVSLLVLGIHISPPQPAEPIGPVKCSQNCQKNGAAMQWNILSQTIFQLQS